MHRCFDHLFRGPQPRGAKWQAMLDIGVRSVVNLRLEDNAEEAVLRQLGAATLHLPVVDWSVPTPDQVWSFIRWVDDEAHRPVFVHCLGGVGRTGLMVSCYRIHHGMAARDALRLNDVEIASSGLSLTAEQERFILGWEAACRRAC